MNQTAPHSTNALVIKTPEGIVFTLPLASPILRFIAWAIDLGCVTAVVLFISWIAAAFSAISTLLFVGIMVMAKFVISIGYGILFEWLWRGQTMGKRLMKLRVLDEQGLKLNISQIVIRNLLRAIDALPFLYLVGGLSCYLSRKNQRLGDLAAGTIVSRKPRTLQPDLEQIAPDKFNSLRDFPFLVSRLRQRVSAHEASIALQALLRRNQLDAHSRVDLFAEIALHFQSLVKFPEQATSGLTDEQYVRNVVDILFRND